MQLANDNEELSIALFGQSGSGKTTLIASMVGNLGSKEQMAARGYRLAVHNAADTNTSLARFMKLEKGIFPSGTDAFHTYRFGFCVEGVEEPAFDIALYDYPGGWWQGDAADVEEQRRREEARVTLASAHVGLLCLDGEQICDHGDSYIAGLLESFARLLDGFSQQDTTLPRSWILAITKADVLTQDGKMPDVRALWTRLHKRHAESLMQLSSRLGGEQVNWRLLLLAAARLEDGLPVDVHAPLGVELIIPLAVRAGLDGYRTSLHQGGGAKVLSAFARFVPVFGRVAKFVTPIGLPFKLLEAAADAGIEHFDSQNKVLATRRDKVERAVRLMRATLASDTARPLYAEAGALQAKDVDVAAGPSITYKIDPQAVLWRTRGVHIDYNFICKPEPLEAFDGWYGVWEHIFGKLELRSEPIYLMGLLNETPYLASAFVDPVRCDVYGRPIRHSVLWLLNIPLEPNPFETGQVAAGWAEQLIAALTSIPTIAALFDFDPSLYNNLPNLLPMALTDSDRTIDAACAVELSGVPVTADIAPTIAVNGLRLPSLTEWAAATKRWVQNRHRRDLDAALLEGDTYAMLQHLGATGGSWLPTLSIIADRMRANFAGEATRASLGKQLALSFHADGSDHFIQHRLNKLHERLTYQKTFAYPRPGFDAVLAALRRHDKDVALAAEPLEADQRAMIAEWLGEALISDAIVTNLRKALLG